MKSAAPQPRELTNRLQIFQAVETSWARLLGGWLPGVARWEAKHHLGLHLWQSLQTARELRTRLWELRISKPDRFEQAAALETVIQRLACAQHDTEFIAGAYLGLLQSLCRSYRNYLADAHPTWDAPTLPLLKLALAQHESQIEWAESFLQNEIDDDRDQANVHRWTTYVTALLDACGLFSNSPAELPDPPPAYECLLPFPEAKRDRRFTTQLHGFDRPDPDDHDAHAVWQFLNYAMEMQAAESLASVLWEADHMPWEFYYDLARHTYDECRHSQMGEERLNDLGRQLTEFPQFTGNYAWRQLYDPLRRYGMLTYVIEQDAFALKHESYKKYIEQNDPQSAEAILYDIIDETMHVRWGVKWLPELIKARGEDTTVEAVVEECRQAVAQNSLNPTQREYRK